MDTARDDDKDEINVGENSNAEILVHKIVEIVDRYLVRKTSI